jgi:hypothetical protein
LTINSRIKLSLNQKRLLLITKHCGRTYPQVTAQCPSIIDAVKDKVLYFSFNFLAPCNPQKSKSIFDVNTHVTLIKFLLIVIDKCGASGSHNKNLSPLINHCFSKWFSIFAINCQNWWYYYTLYYKIKFIDSNILSLFSDNLFLSEKLFSTDYLHAHSGNLWAKPPWEANFGMWETVVV